MIRSNAELVQHLAGIRPPWTLTVAQATWTTVRVALDGHNDIRIIDVPGAASRTKTALLVAVASALQFPRYFGHNWDALEECLLDLEWMPAQGYVIAVSDADECLAETTSDWSTLMDVFTAAGDHWAARRVPFHVVLVTSTAP